MPRPSGLIVAALVVSSSLASALESGPFGGGRVRLDVPELPVMTVPPTAEPPSTEVRELERVARGDESFDALLAAALDVSGVEDAGRRHRLVKIARDRLDTLKSELSGENNPAKRGALLLSSLHAHVFRRYAAQQTYPAVVLETGVYDCVSSAIVYDLFAAGLGLRTKGMMLPSHAYSELLADRTYEVQTTAKDGFGEKLTGDALAKFLRDRHLTGESNARPREISNARLFGLVIENRMSMQHDGRVEGTKPLPLLMAQRALTERLTVLVPADHRYWRNFLAADQQLALRLQQEHRFVDAFRVTIDALPIAAHAGNAQLVEDQRHNVVGFAQSLLRDELAGATPDAAATSHQDAERALGCPPGTFCDTLESMWRSEVWVAAKARSDRHDDAGAWRLVQLVDVPLTDGGDRENVVFFASREGTRRWTSGDHAGATALVTTTLERLGCSSGGRACQELCEWMSGQWFGVDSRAALGWAKRAFEADRSNTTAKQNLVAATRNRIGELLSAAACGDARALLDQLHAAGLDDAEAAGAVATCR